MKTKILVTSIATIVVCLCLIAGSTFALFTETTTVNIAVSAGDLDVTAEIIDTSLKTRSLQDDRDTFPRNGGFSNGGYVEVTDGGAGVKIHQMTPGDGFTFDVTVKNTGDVAVAYTVNWESDPELDVPQGKKNLFEVLNISATVTVSENGQEVTKTFTKTDANGGEEDVYYALGAPDSTTTFTVTVVFPNGTESHDNEYQGGVANVIFTVKTVQANGLNEDGTILN